MKNHPGRILAVTLLLLGGIVMVTPLVFMLATCVIALATERRPRPVAAE